MWKMLPYVLWNSAFAYTWMVEKNSTKYFAGMIVLLRNIFCSVFTDFFPKASPSPHDWQTPLFKFADFWPVTREISYVKKLGHFLRHLYIIERLRILSSWNQQTWQGWLSARVKKGRQCLKKQCWWHSIPASQKTAFIFQQTVLLIL
jgi:hypothetical protein